MGVQQGKTGHSPTDSLICNLLYTLSHKVVTLGTRCTPSQFRAGDTQEIPILNITKFFFELISYQISRPTGEQKRISTIKSERKSSIFQKKCCNSETPLHTTTAFISSLKCT